jgi:hypothetical protein
MSVNIRSTKCIIDYISHTKYIIDYISYTKCIIDYISQTTFGAIYLKFKYRSSTYFRKIRKNKDIDGFRLCIDNHNGLV